VIAKITKESPFLALLGPPGCTQAFPNLRPGLLNCFGVAPEE